MGRQALPSPELRAALAALLGLEDLNHVRSIKITMDTSDRPMLIDVEMFVWSQDVLTSVVRQLQLEPERVTNVKIEVTPKLAAQQAIDNT